MKFDGRRTKAVEFINKAIKELSNKNKYEKEMITDLNMIIKAIENTIVYELK